MLYTVESIEAFIWRLSVKSSWNVMAHSNARQGKWRGNSRMQWVDSTLHTTSEIGVSSITTSDAHNSASNSRLNWRPPADLNGIFLSAAKTESGLCACTITFQTQSTSAVGLEVRRGSQHMCTAVCSQLVRCASGLSDPEVEGTIFFSPGVFTHRQTQRHIWRDSHCHLPTTMEFQNCKIITYPESQTCQNYPSLCAWHIGKRESSGIASVILSFGTWWRWVVIFRPQPL